MAFLLLISVLLEFRDPARGLILLLSSLISGAAAVLTAGAGVRAERIMVRSILARFVAGVRLGLRGGIGHRGPPALGVETGLNEPRAQLSQVLPQRLRELVIRRAHRDVDFSSALHHAD